MAEEKKVEKITKSKVVRRKKKVETPLEKSFKTAWVYIRSNVLVPALKDMVYDAITGGAKAVIFRDEDIIHHSPRTNNNVIVSNGGGTAYNKIRRGNQHAINRPAPERNVSSTSYFVDDIVIADRSEADAIIMGLRAYIEQYEMATVGDLYSMVGATGSPQDEKWGWTDLRGATTRRTNMGHLLVFPDPEALL